MGSRFSMILGVLLLLAPSSWAQAPAYFEGCKLHAHTSAKTAVSADFNPVRIFKQHLSIALNPAVRHISGQVHYRLQLIEARPQLALDLDAALQVDSVWSGNQAIAFSQNALQLLLPAPNGMWPADSTLEFSVQYAGVPPVNTNGFGSFMTAKHGPDSVPVLWTLSQPYGCRDWWPAFQTLGIRADTTWLSVNIPIGYRVGGPGLLQRIDTLGSRVVYHWQHAYSMPPYLLGLAVSEYEVLEQHIPIAGSNDTVFVQDYV
jgi:aminopeptidase N